MTTEPYSTEAILRRNIAALEVALRTQTELKERAEGELAKLREQKPVMKYMGRRLTPKDTMESWGIDCDVNVRPEMGTPLYAAPVPAPHKGATHCDDCGLTWLDDGLNPLRCPYCKVPVPAPAVPDGWTEWNGGDIPPVRKDDQRNYEFLRRDGQLAAFVTSWQHGIEGIGARDIVAYRRKDCLLQSAEVRHD